MGNAAIGRSRGAMSAPSGLDTQHLSINVHTASPSAPAPGRHASATIASCLPCDIVAPDASRAPRACEDFAKLPWWRAGTRGSKHIVGKTEAQSSAEGRTSSQRLEKLE